MHRAIILSTLLFAAVACNNEQPKSETDTATIEKEAAEPWEMDVEVFSKEEKDCASDECSYIELRIPVLKNGDTDVRSNINEYVDSYIRETVKTRLPEPIGNASFEVMCESFLEGYELFKLEFPDSPHSWFLELNGDSSILADEYFTASLLSYEYMGGAHPNSYTHLQSFDLETGNRIDIESKYGLDNLLTEAEAKFREAHSLSESDDLNDAGFLFEDGVFHLPENMGLTPKGVLMIYNSYEVASYSVGATTITIPYSELDDNDEVL
ncbi:MAG: DUF3298 domain-containing protein [Flavobacteriales bacterium]|nr:DUF3298 domain-containing protein [Flavobacteriales bacterium]